MKADAISTEFSEENATLLWRSGLMHSPVLTLTAAQLNQLLEGARAEGAAKLAQQRKGLRGWIAGRLLGKRDVVVAPPPILEPIVLATSPIVEEEEAPAPPSVAAPIEIDEDLQAQIRALYRSDP